MNTKDLIKKNVAFFARYFKLVAVAILISVAVIAGSLVIGDSVRTSLVNRVNERLGNTETVIFANNSYLSEEFTESPLFESSARGILLTNGFISYNIHQISTFSNMFQRKFCKVKEIIIQPPMIRAHANDTPYSI